MKGLDWYEAQLDRDDLDAGIRRQYEAEADRLAGGMTRQQEDLQRKKRAAAERAAEIRRLLEGGDTSVVDLYGPEEFGQDYSLTLSKAGNGYPVWHLHSFVAKDSQPGDWTFEDESKARAQLHSLLYDRMYYKYVKCGKLDSLFDLPDFVG